MNIDILRLLLNYLLLFFCDIDLNSKKIFYYAILRLVPLKRCDAVLFENENNQKNVKFINVNINKYNSLFHNRCCAADHPGPQWQVI